LKKSDKFAVTRRWTDGWHTRRLGAATCITTCKAGQLSKFLEDYGVENAMPSRNPLKTGDPMACKLARCGVMPEPDPE